jgi:hypothetical protein
MHTQSLDVRRTTCWLRAWWQRTGREAVLGGCGLGERRGQLAVLGRPWLPEIAASALSVSIHRQLERTDCGWGNCRCETGVAVGSLASKLEGGALPKADRMSWRAIAVSTPSPSQPSRLLNAPRLKKVESQKTVALLVPIASGACAAITT